jgi:hypothetical protein
MHIQNDHRLEPDEKRASGNNTTGSQRTNIRTTLSAQVSTTSGRITVQVSDSDTRQRQRHDTVATSGLSRECRSQGRSPLVAAMSPVVAPRVSLSFGWRDVVPPISDGEKALSRHLRPHAHFSTEIYKEEAKGVNPLRRTPAASTPRLGGLSL